MLVLEENVLYYSWQFILISDIHDIPIKNPLNQNVMERFTQLDFSFCQCFLLDRNPYVFKNYHFDIFITLYCSI